MTRKVIIVLLAALLLGSLWAYIEPILTRLSQPPGRAELRSLCDLYNAGSLPRLLVDSKRDSADPRCEPCWPQILYIRWQTLRRLSQPAEADRLQSDFLRRFPHHPLAANMLWASAAASLASRDYQNADRILSLLCDRFPDTSAADSARQALAQLR
jgi:hypothetical protein